MQYLQRFLLCVLILVGIYSCNMTKDIEINLPAYESSLVAECYLEEGQPYRLTLFESVSYFDAPELPRIDGAVVTITHRGIKDTLQYTLSFDSTYNKFYNYVSTKICPGGEDEYLLEVTDAKGRKLSAKTKFYPIVPIDTVEWKFNKDSLAYLLIRFQELPNPGNFYRIRVNLGSKAGPVDQDFEITDRLLNGEYVTIGTSYNYQRNDTLLAGLYHLSPEYFDFIQTMEAAVDAGFNPFAQPAVVRSNIVGGCGVFTALSYDERVVIVR